MKRSTRRSLWCRSGPTWSVPLLSERGPGLGITTIGNGPGADPGTDVRAAARLELVRLVEEGKLRVVVAAVYPLYEAAAAHRALESGHTHGKIVLVP